MSGVDLFAACKSGDQSRVKDLLALDTLDINWKNEKEETSLHVACGEGHLAGRTSQVSQARFESLGQHQVHTT